MRTSRRELLTMGGAGVAAIALPSFLPSRVGGDGIALAQGSDAMLTELTAQFQRAVAGLAGNPPKGNARQLASLYRMAAAYARANKVDALIRQRLDAAIASEGHHNVVAKLASVDTKAEIKKRIGIALPPNFQNPDTLLIAKGIGALRGGLTVDRHLRIVARHLEKNAARIDRQIAIANGLRPSDDMVLRRVQDGGCTGDPCPEWDEQPPADDCTNNGDGSMTCTFVARPSPTAPNGLPWPTAQECSDLEFALSMAQVLIGVFWFFNPELWAFWVVGEIGYDYIKWYFGC